MIEQTSSFIVMLVVFGLILYGSYYFSKKVAKISMRDNQSKYMQVEDRLMVGPDKHLAVVKVGDRHLLVGITADEITLLTEVAQEDLRKLDNPPTVFASGAVFKDIMKNISRGKDTAGKDR